MVVDAVVPVLTEVCYDPVVFGNDVLTGYEFDSVVGKSSVAIVCDVSEFYEGVPPVVGVECELDEQLEP